ncbi:MAG: hypothetical protein OEZ01_05650 [Candidatus Heimdallarchaeota archaeon]|nr:hypothetical protein [Candidatus Heimdallarchaeota archaeon]MDH5645469.1 hypothetical protein [Candidatus Heimdallarchaeota archaeon]
MVSFNNYQEFAESLTVENNLVQVVQVVGEEINSFISKSRSLQSSGSMVLTLTINLDSQYADKSFYVKFNSNGLNQVTLEIYTGTELISNYNFGYINGSDASLGQINFDSTTILSSSDGTPLVIYEWSSNPLVEKVYFS